MIELCHISKTFHAGRPNAFTALHDVSVTIQPDAVTVLRGTSGSGKSTLLSILGCMARPTSGRILLNDREITSLPERFRTSIRRDTFGFVFQHFHLVPGLSTLENVMLPAYPRAPHYRDLKRRATALLDRFGIASKATTPVEQLSGGERQRAAIARALINDPAVIIADEPTAHLDSDMSREIVGTLAGLVSDGRTVIMASHDPLVYEHRAVARQVTLRDGVLEREHARS